MPDGSSYPPDGVGHNSAAANGSEAPLVVNRDWIISQSEGAAARLYALYQGCSEGVDADQTVFSSWRSSPEETRATQDREDLKKSFEKAGRFTSELRNGFIQTGASQSEGLSAAFNVIDPAGTYTPDDAAAVFSSGRNGSEYVNGCKQLEVELDKIISIASSRSQSGNRPTVVSVVNDYRTRKQ